MPKGVAVFDLDNTLGDLSSIDYFSNIYDVESILRSSSISEKNKQIIKENYNSYSTEVKDFLLELRDTYEKNLDMYGYTELILRKDVEKIMNPLVNAIDNMSLAGCIIYSNNGNPYTLEFTGRAFERYYERKDIFFAYLERTNPLRNEFDENPTGARKKTVATIQKVTKELRNISDVEPSDIIFFDDLIHPDLIEKGVTYINVKPYNSIIHQHKLNEMFALFEDTLYELFAKYKNMGAKFFELFHIKKLLGVTSVEQMEEQYLIHSRESYRRHFVSDYPEIKDKLDTYLESIKKYASQNAGRKRKSSTRRRTRRSKKKNRTRY